MPIYEQTYRNFEGGVRHQFRWWIVVEQEFRVLSRSKIFKFLILLASIHVLFRFMQVVAYDVIVQDPNHPMAALLKQVELITVNFRMFFDFVRIQSPLMFIILLYAGSGMVCNDFRNNLMEIYFSKPLRWYDLVLGKILTLVLLGLSVTALPVFIVLVQHNLLLPGWQTLYDSLTWGSASLSFSLILVLPTALGILACSSLLPGQNFSAITVFMLLIANSTMGGLLAGLLRERNYFVISFPMALHRIGQHLFDDKRLLFELRWEWSLSYVAIVCLISLWILVHRVRRAEMAA